MFERIKKAILFKTDVYPEVARDKSFMSSAWIIVIVAQLAMQLGVWGWKLALPASFAGILRGYGFGSYLLSVLIATAVGVGGFVLSVFIISWVLKQFFHMTIPWDDLFRPLALAQVFLVVGILGLLFSFTFATWALATLLTWLASIATWVASLYALKTVTGFDWGKTALLVLVVIVVNVIISVILRAIFPTYSLYG